MKKISYQGELGAYSHLACKEAMTDYESVPCKTFEAALNCVREEKADLAMIPVENSVAGRVADIHYLLGDYDLKIYAEHFQEVKHQLLAKKGTTIDEIKFVRSHSMAIGQCQSAIQRLNLTPIVMADTAGSAKHISETGTNEDSAIASHLAAEIYGLEILKSDIQDMKHNTTRFLIMSKGAEIDTKPGLEIYADDVECYHGATAGNVDESTLFYMMARGIDRKTATPVSYTHLTLPTKA